MKLPPPCDENLGLLAARSLPDDTEASDPPSPLHHYERAIEALVSTTYSGLSSKERRELLASLCREKQRLHVRKEDRPQDTAGAGVDS